jgi:cysteine desulfurase
MKLPIYMDHQATTPVDPRVLEAMLPYFTRTFGNAASRNHVFGWKAEAAVDEARHTIAEAMRSANKEIIFTSGATESDNLAIPASPHVPIRGNHVITGKTEHNAVLDTCRALGKAGLLRDVSRHRLLGTDLSEQVRDAMTDQTILAL